jgi:MoaA/NifB/PqqE/SkfB family radical SAM enzyme
MEADTVGTGSEIGLSHWFEACLPSLLSNYRKGWSLMILSTIEEESVSVVEEKGWSLSFLWLEITRKCNLQCIHCYADSTPHLSHGQMTTERWKEIMTEAYRLNVRKVQFIGGEPTCHPDFIELVHHANQLKFSIEVYSNLTHITQSLWKLFQEFNISLATSFYSLHPNIHDQITQNKSQKNTLDNIEEALKRGLNLRVGIIEMLPEQDVSETEIMLRQLGVEKLGKDRLRGIGRGSSQLNTADCSVDELCGSCGSGNAAIDPDGNIYPCVFSRWLNVGNVQDRSLTEVLFGKQMIHTKNILNQRFAVRQLTFPNASVCDPLCRPFNCYPTGCNPADCNPKTPRCEPDQCNPTCAPTHQCIPECAPNRGDD